MSDKTRQAMEDAIAAHIADELGETKLMGEYYVVASAKDMSPDRGDVTSYSWWCHPGMSSSHLFGLQGVGRRMIEENYNSNDTA